MKKYLTALLLIALTTNAVPLLAAVVNFTATWDPYPVQTATIHVQCRANQNSFAEVSTAPATSSANFSMNVNPGDKVDCIAVATAPGFQSSTASEVGTTTVPLPVLPTPTGIAVRVAP